jgi:hypothetical protein
MQILSIGRDQSNNIVLNDSFVSRFHAQIHIQESGQVVIKDTGSSNGTFINGNLIFESTLNQGDILKCGRVFVDWEQYIHSDIIAKKPSQLNQPLEIIATIPKSTKKGILIGNYAVIALLFFLPFCNIKCSDQVQSTFTGKDLMLGGDVPVSSNNMLSFAQASSEKKSVSKVEPNVFIILAFLSSISGLLILLTRNRKQLKISFYLSLLGFVSLIGFMIQIQNKVKAPASVDFRLPFWLAVVCFIIAFVISYLEGFMKNKLNLKTP